MPHRAAGTPGGGLPVGALHSAASELVASGASAVQLAWSVPRTFKCTGSLLTDLPAAARVAVQPWLHPGATRVQDLQWARLIGQVFTRWPGPEDVSASGPDRDDRAAMELAHRALHTIQRHGVQCTAKALASVQEVGAWLLDMCSTELKVRANRVRSTVAYVTVHNRWYGIIRAHVPAAIQCFKDENLGNIVEAAATCMLLREPVPDWAGIRALLTSVSQLEDDGLLGAAVAWAPPVPDPCPLAATSGDAVAMRAPTGGTAPVANKHGRAAAQHSSTDQRRLVCVTCV